MMNTDMKLGIENYELRNVLNYPDNLRVKISDAERDNE